MRPVNDELENKRVGEMTPQERDALKWALELSTYTGMDGISARVLAGYISRCGISEDEDMNPISFVDWINEIIAYLLVAAAHCDIEAAKDIGKLEAGMDIIKSIIASDSFWSDYLDSKRYKET